MLLKDVKTCADRMELKGLEEELNQSFPTVIIRKNSGRKSLKDVLEERFEQLHLTAVDGNPALPEIMYTLGEYGFFDSLREERGKEKPEKYRDFLYIMSLLNRALTETALMKEEGILSFIWQDDLSVMYVMNVDNGCLLCMPFLKDTIGACNAYEMLYCMLRSFSYRIRADKEMFRDIQDNFFGQYTFLLNLMETLLNPSFRVTEEDEDFSLFLEQKEAVKDLNSFLASKDPSYNAVLCDADNASMLSVTVCRDNDVLFGVSRPAEEADKVLEEIKKRLDKKDVKK